MTLSVVIPAYNRRESLEACLDALQEMTTDCEIIVVNGPSTDGTSGMIHERNDVSVLIECASRNVNIARNAGIREATGDIVVILAPVNRVTEGWEEAIRSSIERGADAVSGPSRPHRSEKEAIEPIAVSEAAVPMNGQNIALTRGAVTALDGFDEYLVVGGITDLSTRLKSIGLHIMWHPEMEVEEITGKQGTNRTERLEPTQWVDDEDIDWGRIYRSRAYLAVKHDGLGPRSISRIVVLATRDGLESTVAMARGRRRPTSWAGIGIRVARNVMQGIREGKQAREADHTAAKNPAGISGGQSTEMIAAIHDWRSSEV